MPKYRVMSKRFIDGELCGPGTAREEIVVEKLYKKLPAGLVLVDSKEKPSKAAVKKPVPSSTKRKKPSRKKQPAVTKAPVKAPVVATK